MTRGRLAPPRPITACIGKNGSGKTLAAMVRSIVPALERGRWVVSNTTIFASVDDAHLPSVERKPHPLWIPLREPEQFLDLPAHSTCLVDEISSAFGSRESAKLPVQVAVRLQQLRKRDIDLVWTGPTWRRADLILREVTKEVVVCRGYRPRELAGHQWAQNTRFRYSYFDAESFGEFNEDAAKSRTNHNLTPMFRQRYSIDKGTAHLLYDTFEDVPMLGGEDEYTGRCLSCGGQRRRPACKCSSITEEAA